ncbi:hypothetical protein P691DRAFT_806253 [Macrolepiota fuliginosa MF-IS2]|uniref:Uncharacterized protein n=1 Tax=Macrolepiota fuliginosa MF-IS2 TaxID=1400762 RepID=A0A9P5XMJ1_9AGAR|nr:hypothetical protein P691DRAFT_806253 [Macrolepiota fuliginosa MF-IS2]
MLMTLLLWNQDGGHSEGFFSTREPPASLAQLLIDLGSHGGEFSTSVVVGSQAARQCAILINKTLEDLTVYYVLPYVPATG